MSMIKDFSWLLLSSGDTFLVRVIQCQIMELPHWSYRCRDGVTFHRSDCKLIKQNKTKLNKKPLVGKKVVISRHVTKCINKR